MSTPPKPPPSDAERKLADLEHLGVRHAENLDGLKAQEAHLQSEIQRHDAALVTANDHLAALPADAGAAATHEAKAAVIAVELNRGLLLEELARLHVDQADEATRQKETAKAVEAAGGAPVVNVKAAKKDIP